MKKLYRKREGQMLCGVCSGLGEYLNIDPTILRLGWAILGFTGTGLVAYIVAAIIIPEKNTISVE